MTEQKPYAWTYGRWGCDDAYVSLISPMDRNDVRDVRPLYLRPAPPTEQTPIAWICEYTVGGDEWHPMVLLGDRPRERPDVRNVEPLYRHPAPPTEQKPVAWICEYRSGWGQNNWLTDVSEHRPKECETIRNVRPLYEHPAPAQPATDPAVEAARRKALRAIFKALDEVSGYSDLYSVRLAAGVLRDLVGTRPDDTRVSIGVYDEEPFGQVPEQGPEQPVPMPSWALKNVDEMAQNLYETNLEQRGFAWSVLHRSSKDIWRERARRLIERTSKVAE